MKKFYKYDLQNKGREPLYYINTSSNPIQDVLVNGFNGFISGYNGDYNYAPTITAFGGTFNICYSNSGSELLTTIPADDSILPNYILAFDFYIGGTNNVEFKTKVNGIYTTIFTIIPSEYTNQSPGDIIISNTHINCDAKLVHVYTSSTDKCYFIIFKLIDTLKLIEGNTNQLSIISPDVYPVIYKATDVVQRYEYFLVNGRPIPDIF